MLSYPEDYISWREFCDIHFQRFWCSGRLIAALVVRSSISFNHMDHRQSES